jgi:hypothetical protein
MCTEVHYRFRKCGHTRFFRWDYCSVIIPAQRTPETGHACRRYKLRYKDNQNSLNCFECIRVRMTMEARGGGETKGKGEGKRVSFGKWVKGVLGRG